jgi:steroid delta-isomerase-like uncharacterized protein
MFRQTKRIFILSVLAVALAAGYQTAAAQTEANKAVIDRWTALWKTADLAIADEIFTADFVAHIPHYPDADDLEGYKEEVARGPSYVSDWDATIEDLIAEGDKVVGRFTAGGIWQPLGVPYTNTMIIIFRFVDGRIAEEWWEFDMLGVQQQAGAIPPSPEGPPAMQRANPEDFTWSAPSDVAGDPGDPQSNKALVRREFDAWNQGDLDALMTALDEVYAPSFVYHDPARPHVTDLASYKQWAADECFAPFPDLKMPVDDIIAEGDKVAVRWTFAGTHIALGREITQTGITLARIADGQVVEAWCACDMLGAVMQLTAVTPVDPGGEGLVAYYPLDADAGDASGNGLSGTVMGDTRPIDGIIGGAMEFDGDGDYIEVAHDARLDLTGSISLALWIRPDAEDPEGQGTETAPMAKAMSGMSPSWSWQVRYGWNSPQPYMAFTFNTSPRAWAYVGQNLEQGEWHHIACSADGQTLTAYLNGQATESTPMGAITSSPTPVLIGSDGWSCDWIGAVDEVRIYNRALSAGEILFLTGYLADVTAPGDLVQGVPNDGVTTGGEDNGWPAAETPELAIDDDVDTKYLHFKGDTGPTGLRVKPGVGPTVVTGVSFTTANDVPGRDPIAFELYGSNGSIDGPYTLIASRDIVDFAGAEEWPRFTKTATPIVLNNDTTYTYYQVLFTAIRGPAGGSVNSMQIAEVELFGMPLLPPPDVEANKEVARRFFEEMWNNRDLDIVEELISADMRGHAPTGEFTGYEGERQTILGTVAAFPDLVITIDEMIAEDNKVAMLTSYHGTHTGPLMGQIPPTGAEINMTGAILFHFGQGKIVEVWSYADMLGLMQQIGAASPPRSGPDDYVWSEPSQTIGAAGEVEANKLLVHRFVDEVWNQQKLDVMDEIFAADAVSHNPPIEHLYGPSDLEILRQGVSDYLTAYPDFNVVMHDVVAEGDKAMAYWTVNATHGGELMGIPPTGNPVSFSGHTMYRFADGKIVELWWAWDAMGMMEQITPAAATE